MRFRACSCDVLSRTAKRKACVLPVLRVREIYRRTVNLEDPENGRRYSIVTSEEDFGPRTWLADILPPLRYGNLLRFYETDVPVQYDPSFCGGSMNRRWIPLVREWNEFLEGDLALLASPARDRRFGELLGLGPGSTPAGDDFLVGYTTGRIWLGVFPPFLETFRTTWFSGAILRDAADGLIWKRSKDVLESLSRDDAFAVTKAVARILDWGHSSGRAWLAGLSAAVSDTIERNA